MKYCSRCKRDLPESAFGKNKHRKDGLNLWCKECINKRSRERYAECPEVRAGRKLARDKWAADPVNREHKREHGKKKAAEMRADPERYEAVKARQKQRYAENPKVRAYSSEYHKRRRQNPVIRKRLIEYKRAWHAEHYPDPEYRAMCQEKGREAYRNRTPEQHAGLARAKRKYRNAHRDEINARQAKRNKERRKTDSKWRDATNARIARRRHTKRANGGSYTAEEWDTLCLLCGGRCVKCGQIAKLEVDHIIPVSAGGRNDIENIQPLCRSCNASKGPNEIDYRSLMLIGSMGLSLQTGG